MKKIEKKLQARVKVEKTTAKTGVQCKIIQNE